MAGRPQIYTAELGRKICLRISNGESLRAICREEGMPDASTVHSWLLDADKKLFSQQYARARNSQAEIIFDELLEIADDSSQDTLLVQMGKKTVPMENKEWVNRSRLKVDTRKWYISKVLPKKFGDKLDLTSDGKPLPAPILGGATKDEVPTHDGSQ